MRDKEDLQLFVQTGLLVSFNYSYYLGLDILSYILISTSGVLLTDLIYSHIKHKEPYVADKISKLYGRINSYLEKI